MEKIKIFLFALIICQISCNSSNNGNNNNTSNSPVNNTLIQSIDNKGENKNTNTDCIRGVAEPIINKTLFRNTVFQLQSDSLTGIEKVTFDNGDKLIIKNWGCEYYVLTFRFESSRFQSDTLNHEFWFRKTALLMSEILKGLNAPIDVTNGVKFLVSYIDKDKNNNYKNLKFGDEIDFGGNDIRSFVTVDKVIKLTDKKFAIEISFSQGPL
jgi:hypothetical protein